MGQLGLTPHNLSPVEFLQHGGHLGGKGAASAVECAPQLLLIKQRDAARAQPLAQRIRRAVVALPPCTLALRDERDDLGVGEQQPAPAAARPRRRRRARCSCRLPRELAAAPIGV